MPAEDTSLARPIWSMLNGPQSDLAVQCGKALRVDPRYGPFAATIDQSDAALSDLVELVRASLGEVWIVEPREWPAPAGTRTVRTANLLQMVAKEPVLSEGTATDIVTLDDNDVPSMTDLAIATEPGPWGPYTHRYGQFFGIRDGSRLAAMAGERMRPAAGLAEVSGVCTWPEYRGQGMARRLIKHVMQAQLARGDTPFLHTYASNTSAIGLYESLGFTPARNMMVTVLRSA